MRKRPGTGWRPGKHNHDTAQRSFKGMHRSCMQIAYVLVSVRDDSRVFAKKLQSYKDLVN